MLSCLRLAVVMLSFHSDRTLTKTPGKHDGWEGDLAGGAKLLTSWPTDGRGQGGSPPQSPAS